jgi:hypothetical protein
VYLLRTRIAPAPGKGAETQALLTEWIQEDQARKRRQVGLSQHIFGSEGLTFIVTSLAEELGQMERVRKEDTADPDFQARAATLAGLLREAVQSALFESVLTAPPASTPRTVSNQVSVFPAPGKERRILGILEELVKSGQSAGVTLGLWRRVYSSDGPVLQMIGRYADMADLDCERKERQAISREAVAAVSELSRAPIAQRLTEVIVPIPSA